MSWINVPTVGTRVRATHPITVLNPDATFEVHEVRFDGDRFYARGENTCWFGLSGLRPAEDEVIFPQIPTAQEARKSEPPLLERIGQAIHEAIRANERSATIVPINNFDQQFYSEQIVPWLRRMGYQPLFSKADHRAHSLRITW